MDERIRDIKEGAGREESRINEDLLEFLQKWSTPALLVLAAIAVAYWGWNQYKQMQVAKVNRATSAYTSATVGGAPSPDNLSNIADQFGDVRSFGLLATLDLADVYLLAVQRGLAPGVEYDPATPLAEGDVLDEAGQSMYMERANKLYQQVYDATSAVKGKEPLAIEAAFGLAAIAETKDDFEGARAQLGKAKALADKIGYEAIAIVADRRSTELASAGAKPKLFPAGVLPPLPEPEPVAPPPTDDPAPGVETTPDTGDGAPTTADPADEGAPATGEEGGDGAGGEADNTDTSGGDGTSDDGTSSGDSSGGGG